MIYEYIVNIIGRCKTSYRCENRKRGMYAFWRAIQKLLSDKSCVTITFGTMDSISLVSTKSL